LTNNDPDNSKRVDTIAFQLSSITEIYNADLSDLRINDGTSDIATGPIVDIAGATGTITFSNTTSGLFTLGTSASKNLTLIGDVSNLLSGDKLTIALGYSNVVLQAGTVGGTSPPTNATHIVKSTTVTLSEHAAGQEKDKFALDSSVTDVDLFTFRLVRTAGQRATVSRIEFQLSDITGIVTATTDLSNLRIYYDANGNGTIDGGETATVGGTSPTVYIDGSSGYIRFDDDFTLTSDGNLNYILNGNVINLVKGDTMTISLSNSNVSLTSGDVNGSTTDVIHYTGTTPLIAYSEYAGTNYDLKYSAYLNNAWDAGAVAIDDTANYYYWKVLKTDPLAEKQVALSVKNESGTYKLYASFYDGASWGPSTYLGAVYSPYYYRNDAAYEQMSGELLVVADTTAGKSSTGSMTLSANRGAARQPSHSPHPR
jgi:hypothetical protein